MNRIEFSRKQRRWIWERAGGHCEKCRGVLKTGEGQYDHVIPIAIGGETEIDNGQLICRACGPRSHCATIVTCANCQQQFDRGYRISAKRTAKPQYCSPACRAASEGKRAWSTLKATFWIRTELQPNGCMHWTGRLHSKGYGVVDYLGKPQLAHRIAFQIAKGEPGDLDVCHSCDNPLCVNPDHLWLGTHRDNMDDAVAKGRLHWPKLKGEQIGTSKLTLEEVRAIKFGSEPASVLARKHGVTNAAINLIRSGKNWAWVKA